MKSKLVSRNPIQRFKQGKSIIKAQYGVKTPSPSIGTKIGDWERVSQGNKPLWFNRKQMKFLGNGEEVLVDGNYLKGNGTYTSASLREKPIRSVKSKTGRVVNKMPDGYWYWGDTGKRVTEKEFVSPNTTTTPDGKPVGIDDVATPSRLPKKTNVFLKGFEHRQNEIENLGGVSAVQNLLKKQGYNIGKYGADGKWGSDTEAAYQEYLNNQNLKNLGQQPLAQSAYSNINITQPQMQDFVNIRNANFNRSQTRDLMRTAGYNPYSFSGGQRKALRLYLNGESNDTSELSGIDLNRFNTNPYQYKETPYGQDWKSNLQKTLSLSYRKKGGTLSSRNPITRFKTNFRLVAQ